MGECIRAHARCYPGRRGQGVDYKFDRRGGRAIADGGEETRRVATRACSGASRAHGTGEARISNNCLIQSRRTVTSACGFYDSQKWPTRFLSRAGREGVEYLARLLATPPVSALCRAPRASPKIASSAHSPRRMSRALRRDRRILAYADGLEHGCYTGAAGVGRDAPNEVREIGETHRLPDPVGCYALFAGHGGAVAAELCARNFVPSVLEDERFEAAPLAAMANAVAAMEAFVTSKSTIDRVYYGTALCCVLIRHGVLYTANVGDCRAVLATTDSVVRITEDHTVIDPVELARVKAAGAYVDNGRLNGLLTYTRSLGDLHFKDRKHIFFPGHDFDADILSAEPHLSTTVIGSDALFVLLATETVWRFLSDNAATGMVRASLAKGDSPRAAARRVVQAAISHGADGYVSVLVVLVQDAAIDKNERQRFGTHSRARSVRRVSATSSAGLDIHATPATPPRPMPRSAPVTPLKKSLAEERNRDFQLPTTPPQKPQASPTRRARSLSRGSLYAPSGRGKKCRVLVPVALWGVAPGGRTPLENADIPKIVYPPPSPRSHRKTRNRTNAEARTPERRRTMDPDTMSALASPVRKVSLSPGSRRMTEADPPPGDPARRRTDVEAVVERRRLNDDPEGSPLRRRDSFGVPASLMGRERGIIEDTSTADVVASSGGNATARVSHVTASSGKTAGSGDFKDHEAQFGSSTMAMEFGRGGPAKVRYREHDLFGFLRRRARPASRHG